MSKPTPNPVALNPFYPIVETPEWVERLARLGAKFIQLRAKALDDAQASGIVAASLQICARYNAALVVNDYWRAAIDQNAPWLHLGQGDIAEADMKAVKASGIKLGISTHDEAELENALAHNPDYVALGPVYHTTLKEMPWAPQGLDKVSLWKRKVSCPLVAIGGITLERADDVWAAGADCVSVVTDVVFADDPDGRIKAWVSWAQAKSALTAP